jgi:phosphate-selective porin OprO/OprP
MLKPFNVKFMRPIMSWAAILFSALFIPANFSRHVDAGSVTSEKPNDRFDNLLEKSKESITGPVGGFRYYWEEGLHIDSRNKNLIIKIGGALKIDSGNIEAVDDLGSAFPDLEGSETEFRQARLEVSGTIYDVAEFKSQFELADEFDIKDFWFNFKRVPLFRQVKIGHMKEPFSLEELTSSKHITFMERALPTVAFSPGRNVGIKIHNTECNKTVKWALGMFNSTTTFKEEEDFFDFITDSGGTNVTVRITANPWHVEEVEKVLHLGLSYSHQFRDDEDSDTQVRFGGRPESHFTDERLVDTDKFFVDRVDLINPELAIVLGPLSFQGEYFHVFAGADEAGDPQFWGWYAYLSYFLTSDHRRYKASTGTFSRIVPKHNFRPLRGEWGAWELGLRYSYIDLNDEDIRGGEERNLTLGLNWYLKPNIRFQFNYINAKVEDREDPQVDDGTADIFQARFQIAF